jgi:AcrR family transcriptional regulator
MGTSTERPLRRDAERNRQRILAAASTVFAERGLGASMDDIAREAEVGIGTVYRRFPDKDALIEALFDDRIGELIALAEEAQRGDDAWEGLVGFFERSLALQCADRGLKELMLGSARGHAHVALARQQIAPRVADLVTRAHAAGQLRPDVAVTDFALLQMTMGAIVDFTRDVEPEIWRRLLAIVFDGLRAEGGGDARAPLPVAPLDMDQVDAAMRCWRPTAR